MRCPSCGHAEDRVVDSRATREGQAIRRRRECTHCGHRFTTYEYIENLPLMVVKKDGERESFDRQKLLAGVERACWKRPIARESIVQLVDEVTEKIEGEFAGEVPSHVIGEKVMEKLARLDEVAYVRFASVYRHFRDFNQFLEEVRGLFDRSKDAPRDGGDRS
jgi:transcriptional repressor NrdR